MTGAKWGEPDCFGKRALHLELRTHGQHRDYGNLLPSTLSRVASRRRDLTILHIWIKYELHLTRSCFYK